MKHELSKERLQALKQQFIDDGYNDMRDDEIILAIDALLAAHEQEPVAKVDTVGVIWFADGEECRKPPVGTNLFTNPAPSIPAAVPDLSSLDSLAGEMLNHSMLHKGKVAEAYALCAHRIAETVRECRSAMLNKAD